MSYNPNFTGQAVIEVATSIAATETNNSGSTLLKATPVRVNNSGDLDTIDVSVESHVDAIVGVVKQNIGDGSGGEVASSGRVENIGLAFNFGDAVYISKAGDLTNVKPDIGVGGFVSGDFVVRIGAIGKNTSNPANKDLLLNIRVEGQL